MVIVESNGGRLGNKMFPYAFGRLLAETLGYRLKVEAVRGFPMTRQLPEGLVLREPALVIRDGLESLETITERCKGHRVRVRGYFERAEYYIQHRTKLREWFAPKVTAPPNDKTILHIRATDFIRFKRMLPQDYYLEALRILGNPADVGICTDDPKHAMVRYFRAQGAVIYHQHDLVDFATMMAARNLVISLSTFAWWAAFLSDAVVVQAIPSSGWRSVTHGKRNLRNPSWLGIPCGSIGKK